MKTLKEKIIYIYLANFDFGDNFSRKPASLIIH